jgi:hypothetical protein
LAFHSAPVSAPENKSRKPVLEPIVCAYYGTEPRLAGMQGHALERVLVPATHRDVSRRIADQGRSMCTVPRITHSIDHSVGAAGQRTAIRHATDEAASAIIDLDVRQLRQHADNLLAVVAGL